MNSVSVLQMCSHVLIKLQYIKYNPVRTSNHLGFVTVLNALLII